MKLVDKNSMFSLDVLDFESHNSNLAEDLNWINIRIIAEDDKNKWSASGPFINTKELFELFLWFKKCNKNLEFSERIDFIENEFSVEIDRVNNVILIYLDFDFHPKGKNYVYLKDSEYKLKFDLDFINMDEIIYSLQKLINEFPIKFKNNYC